MGKILTYLLKYQFNMIDLIGQSLILYMYIKTENWMWFLLAFVIGIFNSILTRLNNRN